MSNLPIDPHPPSFDASVITIKTGRQKEKLHHSAVAGSNPVGGKAFPAQQDQPSMGGRGAPPPRPTEERSGSCESS